MRQLGNTDILMNPLILGTWQAGKRHWIGIEDDDSIAAIRASFTEGIMTFDTASIYGDGHSERILGQALKGVREQAVILSKVFSHDMAYKKVIASCEQSLINLQTDYIDLLQVHWPSGSHDSDIIPIEETLQAFVDLKQQGKIRAIGVSNFTLAQLKEAMQYTRIDSLQSPYSLFWRYVEKDLQPYCQQENITLLAYSPLAQGLLTGKFRPGHPFADGDIRQKNKLFRPENLQRATHAIEQLKPIAEQYEISLANLALAWLMQQPQTCAVAGARNAEQALANIGSLAVKLLPKDIQKMGEIGRTVAEHIYDEDSSELDETSMMKMWG